MLSDYNKIYFIYIFFNQNYKMNVKEIITINKYNWILQKLVRLKLINFIQLIF